jgi:hypothetical protein
MFLPEETLAGLRADLKQNESRTQKGCGFFYFHYFSEKALFNLLNYV